MEGWGFTGCGKWVALIARKAGVVDGRNGDVRSPLLCRLFKTAATETNKTGMAPRSAGRAARPLGGTDFLQTSR